MNSKSHPYSRHLSILPLLILTLVAPTIAGCARFAKFAKGNADKTAYRIIEQKQKQGLTEDERTSFTLNKIQDKAATRLLEKAGRVDLGKDSGYTTPSVLLNLGDALAITFANNRAYQTEKESLFQNALGLSRVRYDYGVIPTAQGNADYTRREKDDNVEKFGFYDYTVGLSKKLALTGAVITTNFAHSATHFFNVSTDPSATNAFAFKVVQPLLNGAGPLVAGEPLRQSERDLVYSVRDFKRFQQSFVIDTASQYFNLLQALDNLSNQYHNYKSAILNRERTEMLSAAGRVGEFEADQARQRELSSQDQLNNAQTLYLGLLDKFKITLGIPLDVDFGPDPAELKRIAEHGLMMPSITLEQAIDSALENRLDYLNVQDKADDAERHSRIAFQNFLPTLDATYSYGSVQSRTNDRVDLDFKNNEQSFLLNLVLPLDWTPRRNVYRQSLIVLDQANRTRELTHDQIIVEVRDLWRQLDRSRKNYQIQTESVRLAERRVESVSLLLEAGRVTTRDLLDAQDDLLSAKNALTNALVNHTIQRLQFWNAIEKLRIDPRGMWYEEK